MFEPKSYVSFLAYSNSVILLWDGPINLVDRSRKSEKMVGTTLKMAENGKGSPMVVSIVNPLISLDEGIVSSI